MSVPVGIPSGTLRSARKVLSVLAMALDAELLNRDPYWPVDSNDRFIGDTLISTPAPDSLRGSQRQGSAAAVQSFEDRRSWVVYLSELRWPDAVFLEAEHVVSAWKYALAHPSERVLLGCAVEDVIVSTPDRSSVKIDFPGPVADLPPLLGLPMLAPQRADNVSLGAKACSFRRHVSARSTLAAAIERRQLKRNAPGLLRPWHQAGRGCRAHICRLRTERAGDLRARQTDERDTRHYRGPRGPSICRL